MGKKKEAKSWYEKALEIEVDEPAYSFQQALALRNLGQEAEAAKLMEELSHEGQRLLNKEQSVDFFSKFGEEESERSDKAAANYLLGLAALGSGNAQEATGYFEKALDWDPGHAWARRMLVETK